MPTDFHVHIHNKLEAELLTRMVELQYFVKVNLEKLMATQAELAQQLGQVADQAAKAHEEIVAGINDLKAAVEAAGQVTPEVEAAMQRLTGSVQQLDDLHPDTPVEPNPVDPAQG